jgi:hypothetical protein
VHGIERIVAKHNMDHDNPTSGHGDTAEVDDEELQLQIALQMSMNPDSVPDKDIQLFLDTMKAASHPIKKQPGPSSARPQPVIRRQPAPKVSDRTSKLEAIDKWETERMHIDQDTGLCNACLHIELTSKYPMTHHRHINLVRSALNGCHLCRIIAASIDKCEDPRRSGEIKIDSRAHRLLYRVPSSSGGVTATFDLVTEQG